MTHLINLRQRIKTVETVKKTTHAMQLIAMSTHSRVKQQQDHMVHFQDSIKKLLGSVMAPLAKEEALQSEKILVILIGSQKGLCGTFNSALYKFFLEGRPTQYHLTIIGKQLRLFMHSKESIDRIYDSFSVQNYLEIAQDICHHKPWLSYNKIVIFYQEQKTFFIQRPTAFQLWPFLMPENAIHPEDVSIENPQDFFEKLREEYFITQISFILLRSLLAEQASRFLSMDSATRNADSLLASMKLDYNKLRQALITRELTDLSTSL